MKRIPFRFTKEVFQREYTFLEKASVKGLAASSLQ
jgi:hypothetical protein